MRGTSFSKRRNRWRVAGIEIDFGRLPLLKGRGPGHTPRIPTKVAGAIKTKIRAWRPPEATTLARLGHKQEVSSGRGPRNSWRVYQQPSRKKGRERRESSIRFFCSHRRRDVASRRVAPTSALESCRSPQTCAEDAGTLPPYSEWTCQLFHCVIRV